MNGVPLDPGAFKPPNLASRQMNLRKQALLAQQSHHTIDSVTEDAAQECSRLSIDNRHEHTHPARHDMQLHSWEEYWDERKQVNTSR